MKIENPWSCFIGKNSRIYSSTVLLTFTAILYFTIQWKFAFVIGPSRIFSPSRKADRANFAAMVEELSKAARRACSANPSYRLLFDDGDSTLPYMDTSDDHLGGCITFRETNVTPFSRTEMDGCDVVYIREYEPSYGTKDAEAALQTYNTLKTSPWIVMERWMSSDKRFAFTLYRHPCPAKELWK